MSVEMSGTFWIRMKTFGLEWPWSRYFNVTKMKIAHSIVTVAPTPMEPRDKRVHRCPLKSTMTFGLRVTTRHIGRVTNFILHLHCIALPQSTWIAALVSIRQYNSITLKSSKWLCTHTLKINRRSSDNSVFRVIARTHHILAYMLKDTCHLLWVSMYPSTSRLLSATCRRYWQHVASLLLSTSCLSIKKTVALYSLCELCRWLYICLVPCRKVQGIVCGNECW